MNKIIALVVLMALSESIFTKEDESIYRKIENTYLKSFDVLEEGKQPVEEIRKSILNMPLPTLATIQKRKIAFDVLSVLDKSKDNNILNNSVWRDLEVFYGAGENSGAHLFSKINYTQTNLGTVVLSKMLVTPHANIEFLKKRQAMVRELVENVSLFDSIEENLKTLSVSETQCLAFWEEDKFTQDLIYKNLYFSSSLMKQFNDSPFMLELSRKLSIVKPFAETYEKLVLFCAARHFVWNWLVAIRNNQKYELLDYSGQKSFVKFIQAIHSGLNKIPIAAKFKPILNYGLKSCIDIDLDKIPKDKEGIKKVYLEQYLDSMNYKDLVFNDIMKKEFKGFIKDALTLKDLGLLFEQLKGGGSGLASFSGGETSSENQSILRLVTGVLCAIAVVYEISSILPKVHTEREKVALTNYLQRRLTYVASFLRAMRKLGGIIACNKNLEGLQPSFSNLRIKSEKFEKLYKILETDTFKGEASYFSLSGRVLAAYKLMFEVFDEIVNVFKAAGEIDAYMSIAKLYKAHQNTPAVYSFVNYENATKPHLFLENFWNPFVSPNVVVTNEAELGGELEPNNAIITGPNAGGKSTVLKGITINILLGQTICIVPSRIAVFTPFSKINTYLNIIDDISSGNSLFKAEVLRAQMLVKAVRSLKGKEFGFTIMDEMFSGTSPKEGEAASYAVSKTLAESCNSMCMIATHFPMLTSLEEDTGAFKNYKVGVIKNDDGTLTYPYKLENGLSEQNIAFDILVNEGVIDYSVLGMASELLKKKLSAKETFIT